MKLRNQTDLPLSTAFQHKQNPRYMNHIEVRKRSDNEAQEDTQLVRSNIHVYCLLQQPKANPADARIRKRWYSLECSLALQRFRLQPVVEPQLMLSYEKLPTITLRRRVTMERCTVSLEMLGSTSVQPRGNVKIHNFSLNLIWHMSSSMTIPSPKRSLVYKQECHTLRGSLSYKQHEKQGYSLWKMIQAGIHFTRCLKLWYSFQGLQLWGQMKLPMVSIDGFNFF